MAGKALHPARLDLYSPRLSCGGHQIHSGPPSSAGVDQKRGVAYNPDVERFGSARLMRIPADLFFIGGNCMEKHWLQRADGRGFLWLSVAPRWAELIALGSKTIEWRKSAPQCPEGTPFLLYSSSPQKEVLGAGVIGEIHRGPWRELEALMGAKGAASLDELAAYFESPSRISAGRAIELADFRPFPSPLPWSALRAMAPGFSPPVAPMMIGGDRANVLSQSILALSWSRGAADLRWSGQLDLTPAIASFFHGKGAQLEASYPGAAKWMERVVHDCFVAKDPDRDIALAFVGQEVAGFSVVKISEGKIASLRVEEGFRSIPRQAAGLGRQLFGASCERLGTARPHWTAAPEIWPALSPIAQKMGWEGRWDGSQWVVGSAPQ